MIVPTRTELVGELVQKYYRSPSSRAIMVDRSGQLGGQFAERLNIVFARPGAIKRHLEPRHTTMDERRTIS